MPKRRRESKEERLERKLNKYKKNMNVVKDVKTNIQKIIETKMMLAILVIKSIESDEEIILENIEPEEEEEVEIMEVKEENLEEDIIEAMGPPICTESSYGQPIHPEVYKRVEEAPLLNPELHMIQESEKTRDKKIENRQNLLGLAAGTILKCVDNLTKQNFNKLDIIKNMTEAARILAHLHSEGTVIRKKLLIPHLDKTISKTLADLKRDKFLFGEKLSECVKSATILQKSASNLLKKSIPKPFKPRQNSTTKNYYPPQHQRTQRKMFRGNQNFQRPATKVQAPAVTGSQPHKQKNYRQQRAKYP
ncbi:unnamed protein product [Parnassius apollo]|uniref:(apollo) hypothetical protein n=1 Tax=Parnassius apollo TaxID=110799 RepID=A0A8S3XKQ1_PARAO|nr:unnamed protein product [Parnassius apollo]